MNTNTSFVVRNKNARTLRLIGEKLIQLASLAERADEKGRPLKVEGGVMLHEMSDDKCDEVAYVLQVGDSEMRITVDAHTLELVGRKGFYRMGNVMPDPTFSVGNVESPYDAAVKHFADVGFSSARYSDVVSDGGMDPRNAPAPEQDERHSGLLRRIDAAITAFTSGRASMHVPPEPTDVDFVLEECRKFVIAARPAQTEQQPVGRVLTYEESLRSDGKSGPAFWFGPLPAGAFLYAAPIPQAEQAPKRDREADRARFPDPAFNKWLDEGISDAGHTVWDQVNVYDAWAGWENRQFYAEPVAQTNIADLPFEKLFVAISLAVDAGDVPVGVSVKKFRKVLGIQPNQAQTDELDKLRAVVSSVAAEQFHTMPWNHPHCLCSRCNLIREARDALCQQTAQQPEHIGLADLPYQTLFDAIAAATDAGDAPISVSVKAFRAALSQQVTPQKYDDVLLPFLDLMRTELRANSGKGDRAGWLSMSRETCLLEIHYHLAKLQKATLEDAPSGIREHAADVANMSMMLVDICGLLIEQGETK